MPTATRLTHTKTLPRGIQSLTRTNVDGSQSIKYRVQINRKKQNFKLDKLFDSLDEATECLNASKSLTGVNQINLLQKYNKEQEQLFRDFFAEDRFKNYCDEYITSYQKPKYETCDPSTAKGKAKLRNLSSTKSFFNVIKRTEVRPDLSKEVSPNMNPALFESTLAPVKFGDLKPHQITDTVLNKYIKKRLSMGLKPVSVARELQLITNVFKKMKYMDVRQRDAKIPSYDKDLLQVQGKLVKKIRFRFTDEDKVTFVKAIEDYSNPELKWIVQLCLLTGLRRSECVLLEWSQIAKNHIVLLDTKTNERVVFITPKVKELLDSLPRRPKDPRLFQYTVAGFQQCFDTVMEKAGLSKRVKMHSLRKEAISNFISEIGANNSIFIAEFLGIRNMKAFADNHIKPNTLTTEIATENDVLESVGHSSSQVNIDHYFNLVRR